MNCQGEFPPGGGQRPQRVDNDNNNSASEWMQDANGFYAHNVWATPPTSGLYITNNRQHHTNPTTQWTILPGGGQRPQRVVNEIGNPAFEWTPRLCVELLKVGKIKLVRQCLIMARALRLGAPVSRVTSKPSGCCVGLSCQFCHWCDASKQ